MKFDNKGKPKTSSSMGAKIALMGMIVCTNVFAATQDDIKVSETKLAVDHVKITTPKPYAQVKADLEKRLGKLDSGVRALLAENKVEELRAALTRIAGKDGLALHYTAQHGDLLVLKGQPKNVTAYYIGNVLTAVELTSVNFAAGLYAPLRVVLYENAQGGSTFEYDRPTTLFSQFHSPEIDKHAASLDDRLYKLLISLSK